MKLIPIILTHRLSILGDEDVDVPVHLYTNRLEGDINMNGLVNAKQFEENGVNMTMLTMNYVDIRISFLKRHKKSFDVWLKECYEEKPTTSKKNLVFHGLFDRIECYGSYVSAFEMGKSQEILSITCDKMCYVVETQVLSRKVRQALENLS